MARSARQELPNNVVRNLDPELLAFYDTHADGFAEASSKLWEVTPRGNVVVVWGDDVFSDRIGRQMDDLEDFMVEDGAPFAVSYHGGTTFLAVADPRI